MNQYPYPPTPELDLDDVLDSGDSIAEQTAAVENAWSLLNHGILNLAANIGLLNITYLGAGRFVGATIDTDLAPVAGTGLTIRQPNATLLVEGRVYVIDNPEPSPYEVISGILANKSGGVDVFAGIDDDTGLLVTAPEWQFDVFPTSDEDLATIAGLLHLGRAVTDATSVTDFTASTVDNRGIIRPPGSGAGGGGGDVTTAQLDAAIASLRASFNAQLAALQQQIVPGTQPRVQPIEQLIGEHQITRAGLQDAEVELFGAARTGARSQSASIGRLRGDGDFSGPDYLGDSDLTRNDDGTMSP